MEIFVSSLRLIISNHIYCISFSFCSIAVSTVIVCSSLSKLFKRTENCYLTIALSKNISLVVVDMLFAFLICLIQLATTLLGITVSLVLIIDIVHYLFIIIFTVLMIIQLLSDYLSNQTISSWTTCFVLHQYHLKK